MRKLARSLCVSVVAMTLVGVGSLPALASCDPSRSDDGLSYFDGWYRDPPGTYLAKAVYSSILNYNPFVHSGANDTSAWSMLFLTGSKYYAQVGWLKSPNGTRNTFVEFVYLPDGRYRTDTFPPDSTGTYHTYKVTVRTRDGFVDYYDDGNDIDESPQFADYNEGQIFGEIHTLANQMPGGKNNHMRFQGSHIFYNAGNHEFDGAPSSDLGTTYWNYNVVSTTELAIWDKACDS